MLEKELDRKHFLQTQQATIERLTNLGIICNRGMGKQGIGYGEINNK